MPAPGVKPGSPTPKRVVFAMLLAGSIGSLTGCATLPESLTPGKVERMSPEQLAQLQPRPAAPLSLDDLIALQRSGKDSAALIASLRATNFSTRLAATDLQRLLQNGMPLAVIDHLLEIERRSLHDSCAEQINRHDEEQRQQIERLQHDLRQVELNAWSRCNAYYPQPLFLPPPGHWRR